MMRKPAFRALLLCVALPVACTAFGPDARVRPVLPAPPDQWRRAFPDLGVTIVFPDSTGRMQEIDGADWGTPPTIFCSKAGNTPILAYPRTKRDCATPAGLLRPAGAVFPGSAGQGDQPTLQLTWEDGAAAYVLARLLSLGRDCSLFNAQRLSAYLHRTADPWDLDLDGIAQKIAGGDFSAYDIDELPCRGLSIMAGPGEWFLESPLRPILVPDGAGRIDVELSDGLHALFSVEGRLFTIAVDRTGARVNVVR
jgi:hypothetical protein